MNPSIFDSVFDVVIFGAGYGGFAALRGALAEGKRALLVDRQGALLWEGSFAFYGETGDESDPRWMEWAKVLRDTQKLQMERMDGAAAEILATDFLRTSGASVLYYAAPLQVGRDGKGLVSVVWVGTKSGIFPIRGRAFIDATETGELARLVDPTLQAKIPEREEYRLYIQGTGWKSADGMPLLPSPGLSGLRLETTPRDGERCLAFARSGSAKGTFAPWIPALTSYRETLGAGANGTLVTHGSIVPYPVYPEGKPDATGTLPANLALAVPSMHGLPLPTLADRYLLGANAYVSGRDFSGTPETHAGVFEKACISERTTDVAIAGAGTGGALAAIAAARHGARVTAVELLPFAGGIGSGGGIHFYYFGVTGGLQAEVDDRTRALMPLFGEKGRIQGFHPDAKKCVLESLIRESGADFQGGSIVVSVERVGNQVERCLVSSPQGPYWLAATAWIDATGDGDLAAGAGATFDMGREKDGLCHAFSQSSGSMKIEGGLPKVGLVNYDAGFTDPTDPEDLTRARLLGISQYAPGLDHKGGGPTYIAPALGLRQSRQIHCDTMLTLDDLVTGRRFEDAVGLMGCHMDTHGVDFEFESDDELFWLWGCRNFRRKIGAEIPYRMLLPRGLDNLWVACRAFGVTAEAHPSMRMQRDIHRVGEVSGIAAALSLPLGGQSRKVDMAVLQEALGKSGALGKARATTGEYFGPDLTPGELDGEVRALFSSRLDGWFQSLDTDHDRTCLWHLYRHRAEAEAGILGRLADSDPARSWKAALVAAMWGHPAAEGRLLKAVQGREYGFEGDVEKDRPESYPKVVPNWLTAVALLRRCGGEGCLAVLHDLSASADLPFVARTTLALTLERLGERIGGKNEHLPTAEAILQRVGDLASMRVRIPGRNPNADPTGENIPGASDRQGEDLLWQLHWAIARASRAWGLPIPRGYGEKWRGDARSHVRKLFATLP